MQVNQSPSELIVEVFAVAVSELTALGLSKEQATDGDWRTRFRSFHLKLATKHQQINSTGPTSFRWCLIVNTSIAVLQANIKMGPGR